MSARTLSDELVLGRDILADPDLLELTLSTTSTSAFSCGRHTTDDMLYIIGLGLADERDISARGLEIVRNADRVYLESYTAVLLVDQAKLVRP